MTTKNYIQNEFCEIDKGSSNQAILNLVDYIEQQLPDFPNSKEYVDILEKKKNENQHSEALCVYLIYKTKSKKYIFIPGTAQIGTYSTDIGIYQGTNLIFTIEAKILPTPKPRIEHEYVYGKGAGIQRFRDGYHGFDNKENPLTQNGMIAYIKERDFEYWFSKVNQWILDNQWNKSEQLEKIYFKSIGKFLSKHPRQKSSDVILHHFWIYVN